MSTQTEQPQLQLQSDEKHRASYLTVPQQYNLNIACRPLNRFGYGCHHVGSSLTKADYHDVDLRVLLPDDEFDTMFKVGGRLELLNAAISEWMHARTGLPIDFQFQRFTNANKEFAGQIRNGTGYVP